MLLLLTAILTYPLGNAFQKGQGVLIHKKVVLTTAHVVESNNKILFDHEHSGRAFIHPNYKKDPIHFDIALFILDIPITKTVHPLSFNPCAEKIFLLPHKLYYGDSGTPLIEDKKIIALAIAIMGENNQDYQVVYLSIYPHLDWIKKTIRENL